MYSNVKSVQILVKMLKEKQIKHIVCSAGTTHDAIVRSIEEDNFFKTYSIVDERSAAFFAIGLIQQLEEPVAIVCTAGTAVSNYLTGITEAFYRKLPLIAITSDRNYYYLNQREEQMIDQNLFTSVCKKCVTLPIVQDQKDEWYCNRLLNEAFLEMNHHGVGPIQINIPIEDGKFAIGNTFTTTELPTVKVIKRIDANSENVDWESKKETLKKANKILVIYGQNNPISNDLKEKIEKFASKYNIAIAVDQLSNLNCKYTIKTASIIKVMSGEKFDALMPDIVISLNGSCVSDIQFRLKNKAGQFTHWLVSQEGKVEDCFRSLDTVFECTTEQFLNKMIQNEESKNNEQYYKDWDKEIQKFNVPNVEYSNVYTMGKFIEAIPDNSILNLANSTTIRIAQHFNLKDNIKVYCNRGVNGIDGSMSTFIGQSCVTDKLSFLVIGDLSFFYDMNALWNRYVGKNVRILLNNNEGATLFHFNQGLKALPTLDNAIAAEHFTTAKGWVESQGFKYLSSNNKEEFDENLKEFLSADSDKPILFEVFTKKDKDAEVLHNIYDINTDMKTKLKKEVKKIIGRS